MYSISEIVGKLKESGLLVLRKGEGFFTRVTGDGLSDHTDHISGHHPLTTPQWGVAPALGDDQRWLNV